MVHLLGPREFGEFTDRVGLAIWAKSPTSNSFLKNPENTMFFNTFWQKRIKTHCFFNIFPMSWLAIFLKSKKKRVLPKRNACFFVPGAVGMELAKIALIIP